MAAVTCGRPYQVMWWFLLWNLLRLDNFIKQFSSHTDGECEWSTHRYQSHSRPCPYELSIRIQVKEMLEHQRQEEARRWRRFFHDQRNFFSFQLPFWRKLRFRNDTATSAWWRGDDTLLNYNLNCGRHTRTRWPLRRRSQSVVDIGIIILEFWAEMWCEQSFLALGSRGPASSHVAVYFLSPGSDWCHRNVRGVSRRLPQQLSFLPCTKLSLFMFSPLLFPSETFLAHTFPLHSIRNRNNGSHVESTWWRFRSMRIHFDSGGIRSRRSMNASDLVPIRSVGFAERRLKWSEKFFVFAEIFHSNPRNACFHGPSHDREHVPAWRTAWVSNKYLLLIFRTLRLDSECARESAWQNSTLRSYSVTFC